MGCGVSCGGLCCLHWLVASHYQDSRARGLPIICTSNGFRLTFHLRPLFFSNIFFHKIRTASPPIGLEGVV
uniref:Putative secreted protein n=1 Tax=Anopheles darlingi TaxID=43151 RepID=A0A2M4D8Z2_ANODA